MPVIYYTCYVPEDSSISAVTALERELGIKLLVRGLYDLYSLKFSPETIEAHVSRTVSGKPYLTDHPKIHFNITNTDGLVACAFSGIPVGLDAEYIGYFPPILISKALTESEQAILSERGSSPELKREWFLRLWTLKEAYVKWTGTGVDTNLKAFSFSFAENSSDVPGGDYNVSCSDPEVYCFQKKFSGNQILSLCSARPPEKITFVQMDS